MTDASFCSSAKNCAGHGELTPSVVLAQWRLHSESEMSYFAYLARPAALDEHTHT